VPRKGGRVKARKSLTNEGFLRQIVAANRNLIRPPALPLPRSLLCYAGPATVVHTHLTITPAWNSVTGAMRIFQARPTAEICRRAVSLLALVGVLVSSLGIMFVPQTKRTSSQAFPCQGGSCGCHSAEQCWQSCCCTSVAQRLAWADENDVTPPPFLTELLAAATAVAPQNCCSHSATDSEAASSCDMEQGSELPTRLVLLSDISKCRGLAKYITIFGNAICKPLPDAPAFDMTLRSRIHPFDESFESPLLAPPTPPPRVMA